MRTQGALYAIGNKPIVTIQQTYTNFRKFFLVLLGCIASVFSFLGDPDSDSDVLTYPQPAARKRKTTNREQKFFVLTSKEAYEAKRKYAEDKLKIEQEKLNRKAFRESQLKEKKAAAEKKKTERALLRTKKSSNKKVKLTDANHSNVQEIITFSAVLNEIPANDDASNILSMAENDELLSVLPGEFIIV